MPGDTNAKDKYVHEAERRLLIKRKSGPRGALLVFLTANGRSNWKKRNKKESD